MIFGFEVVPNKPKRVAKTAAQILDLELESIGDQLGSKTAMVPVYTDDHFDSIWTEGASAVPEEDMNEAERQKLHSYDKGIMSQEERDEAARRNAALTYTDATPPEFVKDFDDLNKSIADNGWIIDLGDGSQAISPNAPAEIAHAIGEMQSRGYANGYFASRKTASGYYVVGPSGANISGPYETVSIARQELVNNSGAAVEFKGDGNNAAWEAYKPDAFPVGSNTVNGVWKPGDSLDHVMDTDEDWDAYINEEEKWERKVRKPEVDVNNEASELHTGSKDPYNSRVMHPERKDLYDWPENHHKEFKEDQKRLHENVEAVEDRMDQIRQDRRKESSYEERASLPANLDEATAMFRQANPYDSGFFGNEEEHTLAPTKENMAVPPTAKYIEGDDEAAAAANHGRSHDSIASLHEAEAGDWDGPHRNPRRGDDDALSQNWGDEKVNDDEKTAVLAGWDGYEDEHPGLDPTDDWHWGHSLGDQDTDDEGYNVEGDNFDDDYDEHGNYQGPMRGEGPYDI